MCAQRPSSPLKVRKESDRFAAEKRRFHQGPRATTLNFEAGSMLAVFSQNVVSMSLAKPSGQHRWENGLHCYACSDCA
jgi:hypothetical protein